MRRTWRSATVLTLGLLLLMACPAWAQAPAAGGRTVWHALGIPQGWSCLRDSVMNRSGNHPGLEKKPPLKKLADPANVLSENKALSTAAKIKIEEDLAPQKKKALKYLAQMGCGCYPGVAEAFVEALEDCTEEVRLTAVESIEEAAGNGCANCNSDSCCSPEVMQKLAELAFERDDHGCWKEPSERVRAAAAQALQACCPHSPPLEILEGEEKPKGDTFQGDPGTEGPPATPPAAPPEAPQAGTSNSGSETIPVKAWAERRYAELRMRTNVGDNSTSTMPNLSRLASNPQTSQAPERPARSRVKITKSIQGQVVKIDRESSMVTVSCHGQYTPLTEHEAAVYHDYLLGTQKIAQLQLVKAEKGLAIARIINVSGRIALGDSVALQVEDPDHR